MHTCSWSPLACTSFLLPPERSARSVPSHSPFQALWTDSSFQSNRPVCFERVQQVKLHSYMREMSRQKCEGSSAPLNRNSLACLSMTRSLQHSRILLSAATTPVTSHIRCHSMASKTLCRTLIPGCHARATVLLMQVIDFISLLVLALGTTRVLPCTHTPWFCRPSRQLRSGDL
jgi:hypothetical protein